MCKANVTESMRLLYHYEIEQHINCYLACLLEIVARKMDATKSIMGSLCSIMSGFQLTTFWIGFLKLTKMENSSALSIALIKDLGFNLAHYLEVDT